MVDLSEIPKKYLASKKLREDRISSCNICSRLNDIRQCKECYCFVDLKTWLKNEKCDLKKW